MECEVGKPIKFRRGPQSDLDEDLIDKIVEVIPQVYLMKHVAQINCIPYQTLHTWMTRGRKEIKQGIENSIYVKLVIAYDYKLSMALRDMLQDLQTCPKNYGALTWILEHCYKDEFMALPDDVKKLIDLVMNKVQPLLEQGALEHGSEEGEIRETEEIYSESDQTSGCITP